MTNIHTTPWALYNEIDDFAAAWLEQLIAAGHIARGVVDRRSIADLRPDDLGGFRQVHLFAGIGVWSYACRRAGISDDTEVWTASCPCQPFSSAGKGGGVDDERHLWPHAHHLIRERRPRLIFGEQVASKDGLAWLDLVQADMEGTGYAFGAVDTCAAGFGAPHIRQRQYWFGERLEYAESDGRIERRPEPGEWSAAGGCGDDGLDHHHHTGLEGLGGGHRTEVGHRKGSVRSASPASKLSRMADHHHHEQRQGRESRGTGGEGVRSQSGGRGDDLGLAYEPSDGCEQGPRSASTGSQFAELGLGDDFLDLGLADTNVIDDDRAGLGASADGGKLEGEEDLCGFFDPLRVVDPDRGRARAQPGGNGKAGGEMHGGARSNDDPALSLRAGATNQMGHNRGAGPTNGFWSDADWLHCRDERWRPVEPGTFPLAHGAAARVGRLRGYGNAINVEQAIGFIEAFLESQAIEISAERGGRSGPAFEDLM